MKRTCFVTAFLLLAPVGQPLLSHTAEAQIPETDTELESQQTSTTSALADSTSDCPYGICHDLADSPYQETSLADHDQSADEASEETLAAEQPYDPYAHDPYAHQNYGYWYRHHDLEADTARTDDQYEYDEDYAADPSSPAASEESSIEEQSAYSSAQDAENATEQTDLAGGTHEYDEYGYGQDDYGSYEDEYDNYENEYDAYNYDDEYQAGSYDYDDEYQADADYADEDYDGEDYDDDADYGTGYADQGYNGDDADYGEDYAAEAQTNDEGDYEYDNYEYESEYSYGADLPASTDEVTLEEQRESDPQDDAQNDIVASDEADSYQEPYPYHEQGSYGYGTELYDYDCDEAYWDEMNQEDSPAEMADVSTTTSDMDAVVAEQHDQERELGYGFDNDPYHYAVTPRAKADVDAQVAEDQAEHLYEDAYDDIYNDSDLYGYEDDYEDAYAPAETSDVDVEAEAAKEAEVETATDPEADQYQDLTQYGSHDDYGWDDDAAYYDEFGYGYVPADSASLAERFPTIAHLIDQLATARPVQSSLAWNRVLQSRLDDLVQGVRGLQDRVAAEALARSEDAELEDLFSDPAVEAERQMMRKMARSLDSTGSMLQGFSRRLIQMSEEGQVETATYPGWPAMER